MAEKYRFERSILSRMLQTLLFATAVVFLAAPFARAQQGQAGSLGTHGRKTFTARKIKQEITVDGNLDDPAWLDSMVSVGFTQKDPQEGQPSTEKTEFRVAYTANTLYIGVICYDSEPQGILATERRRDNEMDNDDIVSVVLDTFHDHRNSYVFRTNPLGAQFDELVTDEGNNVNKNWDEKWVVASKVNEVGWTAEFAIPFKSLRVNEENGAHWGMDIERVIRRKNEYSYWNGFRRGFNLESVSQAGHLAGIEEIQTGLRLRVKPYLLGGFRNQVTPATATAPEHSVFKDASDAGIEVMKYRITPSLTADMTYRTDFAQTEVDDQQVNLERFPLFFPEKREFFQEGSGIFEFGIASGENQGSSIMKLFHSRQIGLSPRRQPVPIVAGGRVTGRVAGMTVGLLNIQTEAYEPENIRASNYGVVRVKRDILARSNIGGFLVSREQGGTSDHNRVYGGDANFVFYRYLTIGGMLGKSESPGVTKDNWVSTGTVRWNSDFLNIENSWLVVDRNFRDDVGFIPRKDFRQFSPQFAIRPRPRIKNIRQIVIRGRLDYGMTQNNVLETRVGHWATEIHFQNGSILAFVPHTRLDRPSVPFRLQNGVVIPPGIYSWWNNGIRYRLNPAKRFSGQLFNWAHHFDYYGAGGVLDNVNIDPRLRITENFSVEIGYELNKASMPASRCPRNPAGADCGFTDHTVNNRINYNFNNKWLTTTIVQYSHSDSFLGFNFRLNYIYRPGDDFFLIYNEGRNISGQFDGRKDRTLQAKWTYSFDF